MTERQKPQFSGVRGIFIHLILFGAVAGSVIALLFIPILILLNISMLTDPQNVLMIGLIITGCLINLFSGLAVLDGKKWGVIGLVIGLTLVTIFTDLPDGVSIELLRQISMLSLSIAFLLAVLFSPYRPQFE